MELIASIFGLLKETDPGWAMLIGSMGSLYFSARICKEKIDSSRSGLRVREVNKNGQITLSNDSRVDYNVKAEKYIVEKGEEEISSKKFLSDFWTSKNKKKFLLEIISGKSAEEVLPEQILGTGETMNFNTDNIDTDKIFARFVLIKLSFNSETRYYLLSYANQNNIETSKNFSAKDKNCLSSYNNWVKVYSFE